MSLVVEQSAAQPSPERLAETLRDQPGVVLLHQPPHRNGIPGGDTCDASEPRFSLVTARPFLTFRSFGSRCEISADGPHSAPRRQFGNPWRLLDRLMARYELLEEWDFPLPLGGCFGYWGYDLKNFVEPKLPRRAPNDLDLPDCHLGFYDSLVVFDHRLGKTWIISTGLAPDGSRTESRARTRVEFWQRKLQTAASPPAPHDSRFTFHTLRFTPHDSRFAPLPPSIRSNLSRAQFIARVERAQNYIRRGDIYQVNLSQRLAADCAPWGRFPEPFPAPSARTAPTREVEPAAPPRCPGWELYRRLDEVSPAPCSAFLHCGDFQIASASPELFLRLSGRHILTRPIKGTRPRSADPTRDAQLTYELQSSPKEMAELVMITDLLRNDLGKVSEFGSVQVPELVRLERFPQVQHLVSTVDGRLRPEWTHLSAFAACFPGGSITGAPKFRAMEIIDELEPVSRGPYTGALGYLGFNRESQLNIVIRTAIWKDGRAWFNVGAGIVADSNPEAEYEETLAKAAGFLEALHIGREAIREFHGGTRIAESVNMRNGRE